jgi:signal transduction histidine kinase
MRKNRMLEAKKSWQWMPLMVLLMGLLSIVQILWVNRISERLHIDEALIDTVMDVQISTALYHLRLEEVFDGHVSEERGEKDALAALERAMMLIDSTLSGKRIEHGRAVEPLSDPSHRGRAEAIKALLMELKARGLERLRNPGSEKVGSALERRFEATFKETLRKTNELEDALEDQEIRNQKQSRRLFRSILGVWTLLVASATAGLWLLERKRKRAEDQLIRANTQLLAQAEELTGHRQHLEDLVEKRTVELTAANAFLTKEIAERKQAEETLKESEKRTEKLASWLINAQEIERRRIAMELHDELGQALNATKLHLRVIVNGLGGQPAAQEEVEQLLRYMDTIIEDVRRLSLALSPSVLEDLGLTSAIQWLVSGFAKYPAANVITDIEEIDDYVPEKHQIAIYRVLQEVLTNIRKHAGARHVTIVVKRQDDSVRFAVEDDGAGFDPDRELMKASSERGFGLATMSERVRMAGGILDLRSEEGKGTRITFSIPIANGGA